MTADLITAYSLALLLLGVAVGWTLHHFIGGGKQ